MQAWSAWAARSERCGVAMSAEELLNAKMPLPTLSQGMTNMSDSYLGDPSFFNKNDAPAVSGGAPSSMGPPPSRAWGGSLGNMMMTKSTGTGRQSGGEAAGAAGGSAGYFNNNELSELFSIVRGKSVFGGKKKSAPKPPAGPGSAGGAPGTSYDMSMAGMPGMRSLPPIRTKSADQNGSLVSGGAIGDSPRSELGMPDSAGRLVTGLTPQGGMLMGTGLTPTGHGTGLTPTGLTPGSLAGFPGIDHFSMNLPPGEGGLMPGMPGWKDPTGGLGENPEDAPGGKGKKRKASASGASGGSKHKAPKKSTSKGTGKGSRLTGNGSDDDDVPLSGLVRQGGSGAQSAAALAEAAAKKLGIPMPSQTMSTQQTEDDDDEEGTEGGKSGTKSRSRSWLPSEDELVRSLVAQHGPRKWTLIATRLKTKTQKQVYARWRDYLQPGLTTKPWSAEEQARLVELQAHVGNQWAVLARLMPGRSPNAIKNRYHATKRKLERHNRRDGSNLGPGASDATGATGATGGQTVSVSVGGRAGGSRGGGGAKSVGTAPAAGPAMSEEYSKEEQLAVEGLLLADTPTSLMAQRERRAADAQFAAALDVQDRLGQEATKAAKAAATKSKRR